ncbi:hypothetical protein [Sinanaerobacter sp. ZZT-01]|uniref:hypothetical protein n=1 Tax=Sinanaerobacter sp. ZZT-01 TaxID=3111540 RepID=UPI002D78150B|nr:hypothetical protein [Sinanaerobacter sp. ZZT-01]WRR94170.1 hypothetical protein U5921_03365 [Sinanaerobacter sp. ZZT-01]
MANYVCKYEVWPEKGEYALYRKLQDQEERYYLDELERLKNVKGELWLHLESGKDSKKLEKRKRRLEGETL